MQCSMTHYLVTSPLITSWLFHPNFSRVFPKFKPCKCTILCIKNSHTLWLAIFTTIRCRVSLKISSMVSRTCRSCPFISFSHWMLTLLNSQLFHNKLSNVPADLLHGLSNLEIMYISEMSTLLSNFVHLDQFYVPQPAEKSSCSFPLRSSSLTIFVMWLISSTFCSWLLYSDVS